MRELFFGGPMDRKVLNLKSATAVVFMMHEGQKYEYQQRRFSWLGAMWRVYVHGPKPGDQIIADAIQAERIEPLDNSSEPPRSRL